MSEMSIRKYQKVEQVKVASVDEHNAIAEHTRRVGKSSVQEMTPDEKRGLPRGSSVAKQ